jgi:CsbD-like
MNWDRVEGDWKQFKGKIKEKWGNLTDDDLDRVAGSSRTTGGIDPGALWDREGSSKKGHQRVVGLKVTRH